LKLWKAIIAFIIKIFSRKREDKPPLKFDYKLPEKKND